MAKKDGLYKTTELLKRTLKINYPVKNGRIILRTDLDWNLSVEPIAVEGNIHTFEVAAKKPFVYFKACLVQGDTMHWAKGANNLLLMTEEDLRMSKPYFFGSDDGSFSELVSFRSEILQRDHKLRVYLPPGYHENTAAHYPVVLMQDGQNLFFPEEAFLGRDWSVDDTSLTLRSMSAVEDMIIVGIYSGDRMYEYTKPGYDKYSRSLAEEIVPEIERRLRIARDRRYRIVWGSSLGGVVSFHTVWNYPEVFGVAICMSSTFSYQDDLMERVLTEAPPDVAFYLDSGWPGDNYEVTVAMAMALTQRGWNFGHNLFHLSFPHAEHDEGAWGIRLHLPMQLLAGSVARASRIKKGVLGEQAYRV